MKNVLITGGAGFIGSHVVCLCLAQHPDCHIYTLDALTYAGNLENIKDMKKKQNYSFKTMQVTGANGRLDNCLRELAPTTSHKFIYTDVAEVDITSAEAVAAVFPNEQPDRGINCAAHTAVDKAESDIELTAMLNTTAVEILADATQQIGAGIVHISTNYVFKGDCPTPRIETDDTDPQSVYGRTKLEDEKLTARNLKNIIIRISWLYSIYGNNFVRTMRRLWAEKAEFGLSHFSNENVTNLAILQRKL